MDNERDNATPEAATAFAAKKAAEHARVYSGYPTTELSQDGDRRSDRGFFRCEPLTFPGDRD